MDKNNPVKKAVDEAIDNGKINMGLVGVDKKTGELIFIPLGIENSFCSGKGCLSTKNFTVSIV